MKTNKHAREQSSKISIIEEISGGIFKNSTSSHYASDIVLSTLINHASDAN